MPNDSPQAVTSLMDRLVAVTNRTALAAVIVAVLLGIVHVHLLHVPAIQHLVPAHGVLIALWGVTTVVALGGLAALGGAYTSFVSRTNTDPRVDITILPDDERRLLAPIVDTPGITQVEVASRSDFSDAKVSQTLKALRDRGLVYREPQGRTYRLYPGTRVSESKDSESRNS